MKSGLCGITKGFFLIICSCKDTLPYSTSVCGAIKEVGFEPVCGQIGRRKVTRNICHPNPLVLFFCSFKNTRADSLSARASRLSSHPGSSDKAAVLPSPHPCPELDVTLRMCVVLTDAGTLPGARAGRCTLSVTSLVLPNLDHFQKC